MKHPIQPLAPDPGGKLRFKCNEIVRFLLDHGPYDLNDLACMQFSDEDWEQFAQLIGYSLGGFGDLSYVSDETYNAADLMANGLDERDARIASLQEMLGEVRRGLRIAAPAVFRLCAEDLDGIGGF